MTHIVKLRTGREIQVTDEQYEELRRMVTTLARSLNEGKADAWEAGYGAGRDDEAEGRSHRDPHRTPNPYKETA